MSRLLKTVALLSSALFTLLLLLVVAAIAFLEQGDLNDKRAEIAKWLSVQTGWIIQLNNVIAYDWKQPDKLTVHELVVEVAGVRIAVGQAQANLKLSSLLKGSIVLETLTGNQVRILAAQLPPPASESADTTDTTYSIRGLNRLVVDAWSLRDLQVNYPLDDGPLQFRVPSARGNALSIDRQGLILGSSNGELRTFNSPIGQDTLSIERGELVLSRFHLAPNLRPAAASITAAQFTSLALGNTRVNSLSLNGGHQQRHLALGTLALQGLYLDSRQWFASQPASSEEEQKTGGLPLSWLERISVSQGNLKSIDIGDKSDPEALAINGLQLSVKAFDLPLRELKSVSGQADWQASKVSLPPYDVLQVIGTAEAQSGVVQAAIQQGSVFGGTLSAQFETQLKQPALNTVWKVIVDRINVKQLDDAMNYLPGTPSGEVSLKANGSFSTGGAQRTQFSLGSNGLTFPNFSLDDALIALKESKDLGHLSQADLPMFLFLGPIGILARQGVIANRALQSFNRAEGGVTHIKRSQMDGRLTQDTILINDLALVTDQHRIALRGTVDLEQLSYQQVIIALLNSRGCIDLQILLNGPLKEPEFATKHMKADKNCQPFYPGPVPHPAKAKP